LLLCANETLRVSSTSAQVAYTVPNTLTTLGVEGR